MKYLNQAEDGDRLWDKLYNWAKDAFMDAYDSRRICRPGKEPGKHGILPENHQRMEGLKEGGVLRPRLFCYPEGRRWNGWA